MEKFKLVNKLFYGNFKKLSQILKKYQLINNFNWNFKKCMREKKMEMTQHTRKYLTRHEDKMLSKRK